MVKFKIKGVLTALTAAVSAVVLAAGAMAAELPEGLVPVGRAVGISVKTDGVMVSELSEFETKDGKVSPARDAGILPGDVITAIDGVEISSAGDMLEALEGARGEVTVKLTREGVERQTTLTPFREGDEAYLGVWVRDGLTGIGTVTYFDPENGSFGALGHSIADSSTGLTLPLREGELLPAQVTGVTKSRAGTPGQLGGTFDFTKKLGKIEKNCGVGIFGDAGEELSCAEVMPVASREQVKPGPATIISDASGQRREYSAEITRVYSSSPDGRDMMLKITDPELLELTGGIVQGMSGSPIIQNGRLAGAVTHVLINNPEKGYGVLIENMLAAA